MATTPQFLSGLAVGLLLSLLLLTLPYLLPTPTTHPTTLHAALLTTLTTRPYLSIALLLPALLLLLAVHYRLYAPYSQSLPLPNATKARHSKRNLAPLPPPYPTAYYRLLTSSHLRPSAVLPATLCQSHDLVVYRPATGSGDGGAVVLDAYCPHLGAHLAYGGKVVGDCIDCPFHGWRFNRAGRCTLIPYAAKVPDVARTAVWATLEVDDGVMVWYDADGGQPGDGRAGGGPARSVMDGGGGRCVGWLSMEVGGHVREVMEAFIDRTVVDVDNVYGVLSVRWQRLSQWREAAGGEGRVDIQLTVTAAGHQLYALLGELQLISPVHSCLVLRRTAASSQPSHYLFLSLLPAAPLVHTLTAALYTPGTASPVRVLAARLLVLPALLAVVRQLMGMASARGEAVGGGVGVEGIGGVGFGDVDGGLVAYRRWYDGFCSAKGTKRRDGVEW